eukprot:655774-Prymnesium_polylepis.1
MDRGPSACVGSGPEAERTPPPLCVLNKHSQAQDQPPHYLLGLLAWARRLSAVPGRLTQALRRAAVACTCRHASS